MKDLKFEFNEDDSRIDIAVTFTRKSGKKVDLLLLSNEQAIKLRDLLTFALKQDSETDHSIAGAGC